MQKVERIKTVLAYVFIGYSLLGILIGLSYQLDWDITGDDETFGRGFEGGASNAPIFYGLSALAGVVLLSTIKGRES